MANERTWKETVTGGDKIIKVNIGDDIPQHVWVPMTKEQEKDLKRRMGK